MSVVCAAPIDRWMTSKYHESYREQIIWLLILSNHSCSTLVSYNDRSAEYKQPAPGYFRQLTNPVQSVFLGSDTSGHLSLSRSTIATSGLYDQLSSQCFCETQPKTIQKSMQSYSNFYCRGVQSSTWKTTFLHSLVPPFSKNIYLEVSSILKMLISCFGCKS